MRIHNNKGAHLIDSDVMI